MTEDQLNRFKTLQRKSDLANKLIRARPKNKELLKQRLTKEERAEFLELKNLWTKMRAKKQEEERQTRKRVMRERAAKLKGDPKNFRPKTAEKSIADKVKEEANA